jgi:hypothetical protein
MVLALSACMDGGATDVRWPEPTSAASPRTGSGASDCDWIGHQPICVGSRSWSAGTLGNSMLFRYRRAGHTVEVGYFVYWSTERPWGANTETYTLLPALATDAFYSHFLYVFPGAKDVLYGPGDIEGASIQFEELDDGTRRVLGGTADDGHHSTVALSPDDLLDEKGRLVLLTDVWSHQLGAHGGARFAHTPGSEIRCYHGAALHPMTTEVARVFRLGDAEKPLRAKPAWLGAARDERITRGERF